MKSNTIYNFTGVEENIIEETLNFNGSKIKVKKTKGIEINYENKNILKKQNILRIGCSI